MLPGRYELKSSERQTIYEFVSVGRKGQIRKVIQYSNTNLKDFYNLGFGDINESTSEIDDTVVSNNGDMPKVLATVAASTIAFTNEYPQAWIYATGSTDSRTRLYQRSVEKMFSEISKHFEVYGLFNNNWEEFIPKTKEYTAFLIKRR
jgi:hypothetical protein